MKRFENQLKIQQLESDALRMRLIDAESSSERRRRTLEQGTEWSVAVSRISQLKSTHAHAVTLMSSQKGHTATPSN